MSEQMNTQERLEKILKEKDQEEKDRREEEKEDTLKTDPETSSRTSSETDTTDTDDQREEVRREISNRDAMQQEIIFKNEHIYPVRPDYSKAAKNLLRLKDFRKDDPAEGVVPDKGYWSPLSVVIDDIFTYRRPTAEQQEAFDEITSAVKRLAKVIIKNTPPCKDRISAIEKLREVRMIANASVALEGLI